MFEVFAEIAFESKLGFRWIFECPIVELELESNIDWDPRRILLCFIILISIYVIAQ